MPMYWTFNCFLGCIYTVFYIVYIFLALKWHSNLEFRIPKKRTKLPELGSWGGGLGNSGNARKKMFFLIEAFPNIYIFYIEVKTKRTFLIKPLLLPIQSDKIADNSMGNNFLGRIAEVLEVLWNVLSNTFLKYLLWIDSCYILSHRHWQNYAIASKKENKKQGIIKKKHEILKER